tara:strand:- start:459 stop:971 length:513 start_codon:yes stop_codon:yes gene_type:complete
MQLVKLHEDFYQILDVFQEEEMEKIQNEFIHHMCWKKLSQGNSIREEGTAQVKINWGRIQELIDEYFGVKSYTNTTQLWYDWRGYTNEVHKDLSPNLSANVQVYLSKGDETMGTHCYIDETWYSVPYKFNSGYLMFNPTKHEHGMRSPVQDYRMSLYQSFRITKEESPIW